jgi:hypothetical protein
VGPMLPCAGMITAIGYGTVVPVIGCAYAGNIDGVRRGVDPAAADRLYGTVNPCMISGKGWNVAEESFRAAIAVQWKGRE